MAGYSLGSRDQGPFPPHGIFIVPTLENDLSSPTQFVHREEDVVPTQFRPLGADLIKCHEVGVIQGFQDAVLLCRAVGYHRPAPFVRLERRQEPARPR
jgi:hypothetical protein